MRGRQLASTVLFLASAGLFAVPTSGRADDGAAKTAPSKASAASSPAKTPRAKPAPLSAEREAQALAFAREHHPELAALIEKLRKDNRRQFDQALRQLSQDRDRLVRLKKQSPPQYELALALWKLDSRAHLLAARMTVSQDPALEAELKQILRDRVELRLKKLRSERDRLQGRLTTVNKSIQKIESDKAAVADADLQRIKRSIARSRRPTPKKHSPAETQSNPTKPLVAERPQLPTVKSAASVTAPAADSPNTQDKAKQD
jgi:flagellar biosynthesis GTPase FlhF